MLQPANNLNTSRKTLGGIDMYERQRYISGATAPKVGYESIRPTLSLHKEIKKKSSKKMIVTTFIAVILISVLMGLIIYRSNSIIQTNYVLSEQKRNLEKLVDENTQMKVYIEKNLDLNKVKNSAINDLGMQKPTKDQLAGISVPSEDIVLVNELPKQDESIFTSIGNFFKSIFG